MNSSRLNVDQIWTQGRFLNPVPCGNEMFGIFSGALACRDGRIVFAGNEEECLHRFDAPKINDLEGRLVTPGFIDCHTHLVYAGNRSREFEDRSNGVSYEAIAAAGGGILATVRATRAASRAQLLDQSLPRLDALIREGVTTVEIKSGYGLDLESELRILQVARELEQHRPIDVVPTFLGAHAVPAGFTSDEYLDFLCQKMLPEVAASGLTHIFDAFCEKIAFNPEQIARAFACAQAYHFKVKLHADQLSPGGGAQLAAAGQALSADHLEYTDEKGVAALARSQTVAVLLPGAYYFLRQTQRPPVDLLRKYGVPIAVATDCNPGTSPLHSLLIAMNLAATLFQLSVGEILSGVTRVAAAALGLDSEIGALEPGKWCNLAIWNVDRPVEIYYRLGTNPLHQRVWRGQ
jgi:imidazolonepropionase